MVRFYLVKSNHDCLKRPCVKFLDSKLLLVQHRLSISKFVCIRVRKILWVFIFNINMRWNVGTFLSFSRTWFTTTSFPPRGCLTTTFRFFGSFFWNTKNKKNYTTEIWDIMLLYFAHRPKVSLHSVRNTVKLGNKALLSYQWNVCVTEVKKS